MYDRYQEEEGMGLLGPAAALTAAAALTPGGRRLVQKGLGKAEKAMPKAAAAIREEIMSPLGSAVERAAGSLDEASGGAVDILRGAGRSRAAKRAKNIAADAKDPKIPVWQRDYNQMKAEALDTFGNIGDTIGMTPAVLRNVTNEGNPLWAGGKPLSKADKKVDWNTFANSELGKTLDKDTLKGARNLHLGHDSITSPQDAVLAYMKQKKDLEDMFTARGAYNRGIEELAPPVKSTSPNPALPRATQGVAEEPQMAQFNRYSKQISKSDVPLSSKQVESIRERIKNGERWANIQEELGLQKL